MASSCEEIIRGERVSWTNYGAITLLWHGTPCKKCKNEWRLELERFHFKDKKRKVVDIWRKNES